MSARGKSGRRRTRLTHSGWVFVLVAAPILAAAWNTGNNLLYIVVGGLFSFLILSVPLSIWMLRRLHLYREAPRAVHRNQPFFLHVRIENRKRWMPSFGLRLEQRNAPGTPLAYLVKLGAQRAARLNVEMMFPKRGVYALPPFDFVSSFPFGLVESRVPSPDQVEVLVYPRLLPVRTKSLEEAQGGRVAARQAAQNGEDYFDLRQYIVGDDVRHIAWRISARRGEWMVRQMAQERVKSVVFLFDARVPATLQELGQVDAYHEYEEDFEEAVDLVASFAVLLLSREYTVGLLTPERHIDGGQGSGQQRRILDELARVQPVPEKDHLDFEERARQLESRPVSLLYVTPVRARWGLRSPLTSSRALDPREVIYA